MLAKKVNPKKIIPRPSPEVETKEIKQRNPNEMPMVRIDKSANLKSLPILTLSDSIVFGLRMGALKKGGFVFVFELEGLPT